MRKNKIINRGYTILMTGAALVLGSVLCLPGVILAQPKCLSTKWPYELSDIDPSTDLTRGRLPNGLRYIIKKNNEPENRVAMYLDVQAGSFHEEDDQRGVAHFLEHMMFIGTEHFPSGTLVEYFQSIGMGFGNDVNAHTSYDETVYHLILPDGSSEVLEQGLLVMADYARGALLLESEIDRERGVILAEKRARDSASYRTQVARTDFSFRGTQIPDRRIIGTTEVLEKADKKLLTSYYDKWYRPENMVLVIVGNVDSAETENLLTEQFSRLSAAATVTLDCPDFGHLKHTDTETFYHYEPELGKTEIAIETLWNINPEDDSVELETRELIRYISAKIIRYRLQELREKPDSPFTRAGYYYGDVADHVAYGTISAKTDPENWQKSLNIIITTLRQGLDFGFSEAELTRVKKQLLADIDAAVLQENSEDSNHIARKIIRHINSNRVYQSASQEQELYTPIIEIISLDDVNKQFRKIWSHDSRLISVTGDTLLTGDAEKQILSMYQSSTNQPIAQYDIPSTEHFPYLPIPEVTNKYIQYDLLSDLGIEKFIFKNGLTLNLKKTDFKENGLQVIVNFGHGELNEPVPGMAMLAEDVINGSGSGKLTQSEFNAVLAGSSIDLRFRIGESSYLWTGSSLKEEFDLLLEVLYTFLLDPGLRKSVFDSAMIETEQMYKRIGRDVGGAMMLQIQPFLGSGNPHFGMPPWSTVASIKYQQLAEWVQTISPDNGLEISVVGDFNREQVLTAVTKYFSGLKLINDRPVKSASVVFPQGQKKVIEVDTSIEKSLIFMAWPSEDFWDISRTRRLHILAAVLEDRIRKAIRVKLGATYSPGVYSSNSRTFKGYGFLAAQMMVKPGEEQIIITELLGLAEELQLNGISDQELERAKKPMITSIGDSLKENNYWLYSVLSQSSRHPDQFIWPKTILSDFSSITREEINLLARKYLNNNHAAIALARPDNKSQ